MKIYHIWYIEGDFWGVLGCEVCILEREMGVEDCFATCFGTGYTVCASPKVGKIPQYGAKMAHFALFLPIFA